MSVVAMPQRPKPELRSVEPLGMSATAASAVSQSLEEERLGAGAGTDKKAGVEVKVRRG
jgi:hypothetical protein